MTRLPSDVPMLPDIESTDTPWHGSAGSEVEHWKSRALAAEDNVRELLAELAVLKGRPPTRGQNGPDR